MLTGAGIVLGIVTWTFSLHQFVLAKGSGWSLALLAYSIGINLLAVGLHAALVTVGYRARIIDPPDLKSLRSRAAQLFFALVALSVAFVMARLVQPIFGVNERAYVVRPTDFLAIFGIVPLLALIVLIVVLAIQPIVKRLRSKAGPRKTVLTIALIAGFLPLAPFLVSNTPLNLLSILPSYEWFTDLRGYRPTHETDLVVVEVRGVQNWDLVRFLHSYNPARIVVIPSVDELQDEFLTSLNTISRPDSKILLAISEGVSSYVRTSKMYSNLTFAAGGFFWRAPVGRIFDDNDALTAPFLLAAERNGTITSKSFEKFKNEEHLLLAEEYSRHPWLDASADAQGNTWNFTANSWSWKWSEYRVVPGKGVDSVLRRSSQWSLDSLGRKTIIVNFLAKYSSILAGNDLSLGGMFARILVSAEHAEFRKIVSSRITGLIGLVLLLINAWCYYRMRAWVGLGLSLLINLFAFGLALLVYVETSVILFLTPMIFGIGFFTVILFPYELSRERSENLEERTRLATELKTAREMQFGLMPSEDPKVPGYDIAGVCVPASEVGGDFYDYLWLDRKQTKLGIAVADVSGKAMKAAMTAVMTSGMLYSEAEKSQSAKLILARVNRTLYLRSDKRIFTALSFSVINTKAKLLTYSSAGQMAPLITLNGSFSYLKPPGVRLPLGLKEQVRYKQIRVKLKKGNTLILYTDGISEAMNSKQEMYGFDRLERCVKEANGTARDVRDRILDDVRAFAGTAPQHDDMTVVVVKVD
ncbi:MAG: PP2C family protein-serine/threonine phosphatase [Ignavibacteriales bacterium]|nr:PP2C family protein-serine/threonine phosphatase [Ignavibacteriales bacterium]